MDGRIEHRKQEQRWVYVDDNNRVWGELNYQIADEQHWHIHHTGVDSSLRGQGIARRLVDAADAYSKHHHIRLSSSCSYATVVLARKQS